MIGWAAARRWMIQHAMMALLRPVPARGTGASCDPPTGSANSYASRLGGTRAQGVAGVGWGARASCRCSVAPGAPPEAPVRWWQALPWPYIGACGAVAALRASVGRVTCVQDGR